MQAQTYLFFDGRCEEALEFYRDTLGAEAIEIMRFRESPEPGGLPPDSEDKVMHASFRIGDTTIMASDGHCTGKPVFQGFALALTAPDIPTAERLFAALTESGQVRMPMAETFFAPRFGMVEDRFGVSWMVLAAA